jgi:PAS domain-containing protein
MPRIWNMSRDILAVGTKHGVLLSLNPAFEAALQLEQLLQGRSVEDYEVRMRHSDASARWISWTLVPAGERLYGIGRDNQHPRPVLADGAARGPGRSGRRDRARCAPGAGTASNTGCAARTAASAGSKDGPK